MTSRRGISIGLAVITVSAGVMKLAGQKTMKQEFRKWGYSDRFRIAVGVAELSVAALLATPAGESLGRFGFAALMVGAAATHLKSPGERPRALIPAALLIVAARPG